VDPWADLKIDLKASAARAASWGMRAMILLGTALALLLLGGAARWARQDGNHAAAA